MRREAELISAIKAKCVECSGNRSQAKACRIRSCPLYAVTDLQQPRRPRKEKKATGEQLRIKITIYGGN